MTSAPSPDDDLDDGHRGETSRHGTSGCAVDIVRSQDAVHILVDLPGTPAGDVSVHVQGHDIDVLTARRGAFGPCDHIIVHEREHTAAHRRISLPHDADPSTLAADCTEGLLHLAAAATGSPRDGSNAVRQRLDVATGGRQLAPPPPADHESSPKE